MDQKIKRPNIAGSFYPENPQLLKNAIFKFLDEAQTPQTKGLKGLVVPHAGLVYSGSVAATGYNALAQLKDKINRVVIFAPTHYVRMNGIATLGEQFYQTPLGDIPIDKEALSGLIDDDLVYEESLAFEREHALEIHLPFLQSILTDFTLIPFIVGEAFPESISKVIQKLDNGKTFFIFSSDLSHFHSYEQAKEIDTATGEKITSLSETHLHSNEACGHFPLRGLINWAKKEGFKIETLDLRNSGDTAGDKSRVVGYGTFGIYSP